MKPMYLTPVELENYLAGCDDMDCIRGLEVGGRWSLKRLLKRVKPE